MENEVTKIRSLKERRFDSIIFLLRLAGIPLQMKKVSTIYAVYMRTVIICASTTYLGTFVDVYVHRHDLGHVMTTMRVLISVTDIMWIYIYCRYVRTLATALYGTQVFVYQTQHYTFSNNKKSTQICYRRYKFNSTPFIPDIHYVF
jgi:hypothetical protein